MKKLVFLSLLLTASTCFSQLNKKILGKWVICSKIDALIKLDTLTLLKEDAGILNACIEKNCVYTRWTFENKDAEQTVTFFREAGCKGASSLSDKTFSGKWSVEKDKKLIIFDDQFAKHIFTVISFNDKQLKLKEE